MVRPGFYLGRAYLNRIFGLNFTLYNRKRKPRARRISAPAALPKTAGPAGRSPGAEHVALRVDRRVPHQEALTVVAESGPGMFRREEHPRTIAEHVDDWDVVPFARLANVHFARLVVFDETTDLDGKPLPAQLALMTNIDAPLDAHLHELATVCGAGLDESSVTAKATRPRGPHAGHAVLVSPSAPRARQGVLRQPAGPDGGADPQEEELRRAINDFLDPRTSRAVP